MKTVPYSAIVTGAAGFLGSHLVDRLLEDGHTVTGVDSFVTGSRTNLATAGANERFTLVEADASKAWDDWLAGLPPAARRPNLILHFASPASPVDYGNDPLGTMAVNALGTMQACTLAQAVNARVLFASTSECYGEPLEHPQRESYWGNVNPIGVRACYDESKRFGEAYLTSAVRSRGIDGRIARIFNTYGPRMRSDDGRVIPSFCMSALRGEPLTIYGNGQQSRSFCYVDDVVEGIVRLATRGGLSGRVVNIGNPTELTVRDLAERIARLLGVELRTVEHPLPPDDPTRPRPDITLARSLLDWSPAITLESGLIATIASFRERHDAQVRENASPSAIRQA